MDHIVKKTQRIVIYSILLIKHLRILKKIISSLKGALPSDFYLQLHIELSKFSSLIDEINKMQYSQEESDDVIGRVYEYFLKKFCIAAI